MSEMPDRATDPLPDKIAALSMSRRDLLVVSGSAVLPGLGVISAIAPAPAAAAEAAMISVALKVNGASRPLSIDPRQSLLDVLRETLNLTGTKKGCNQGACGACTVLVDGKRINSCLTFAAMHEGADIRTIEGLAEGDKLHPLQVAFVEHEGFQCGFCTAGQIMSGVACMSEGHAKSPEEIRFWMSGNICRCGAYPGIVAAVASTAERS